MSVSDLLHAAVIALASARPGPGVGGRAAAALRGVGLRALLAAMLSRQHLGELLVQLERGDRGQRTDGAPGAGTPGAGPPAGARRPAVPAAPSRPGVAVGGQPEAERATPGRARAVLDGLGRWHTTCLYRSLAGYAVLRSEGQDVRFLIGVRPDGDELRAHAWLEQGGVALGEPGDPRERWAVAFIHPGGRATCDKERQMPTDQLRANPDALLTELKDGSGVLLHLRTKFYYTLNQTGVAAWKVIAAGQASTAEAVTQAISAQFRDAPAEAVQRDVAALLGELLEEGLLLPPSP